MRKGSSMISPYRPETEFYKPEGCYIIEMHTRRNDHACSIARARVPPGVTTKLHVLAGIDERYVILDGEGSVEIAGGPATPVRAHDVALIPAGRSQRITNTGTGELVFLCVCTPPFDPDAYVNLEEEGSS
jgi:mannose-6-phosphate isomerase-like protein (cupin superfamily)